MAGGAFSGAQEAARYIAELTKEMRALSDLPLGELGDQLKEILAKSKEAVKELTTVREHAESTEQALARMNTQLEQSHASAMAGSPGFAAGEAFTPEQLNIGGPRVNPAAAAGFTALL